MTPDALRQTLHGVIAFPVTPFRSDLSLDAAGLRANIGSSSSIPSAPVANTKGG
jgi:hypothetical protein